MNRQDLNSHDPILKDEYSLFDADSVSAAQIVEPLNYQAQSRFARVNGERIRVIVRKSRSGGLDKTIFALSLLAVAILGCIAGTLLHFSNNKQSASNSRYTNSADIQTATLLKPTVAATRDSSPDINIKSAPLAVQQPVSVQNQPVKVVYRTVPESARNQVAIEPNNSNKSEDNAVSTNEFSVNQGIVSEIKNEVKRKASNKKTDNSSAETESAERLGRELGNQLERENK